MARLLFALLLLSAAVAASALQNESASNETNASNHKAHNNSNSTKTPKRSNSSANSSASSSAKSNKTAGLNSTSKDSSKTTSNSTSAPSSTDATTTTNSSKTPESHNTSTSSNASLSTANTASMPESSNGTGTQHGTNEGNTSAPVTPDTPVTKNTSHSTGSDASDAGKVISASITMTVADPAAFIKNDTVKAAIAAGIATAADVALDLVTVVLSLGRRLRAAKRRLSGVVVASYTITVPAGASFSATSVMAALTPTALTNSVANSLTRVGTAATVTSVASPTVQVQDVKTGGKVSGATAHAWFLGLGLALLAVA